MFGSRFSNTEISVNQQLFIAFISIITLLKKLDVPQSLGPNLAVICLSGLYAVIIEFLLLPLKTKMFK